MFTNTYCSLSGLLIAVLYLITVLVLDPIVMEILTLAIIYYCPSIEGHDCCIDNL